MLMCPPVHDAGRRRHDPPVLAHMGRMPGILPHTGTPRGVTDRRDRGKQQQAAAGLALPHRYAAAFRLPNLVIV
jgi:hypothetical protein